MAQTYEVKLILHVTDQCGDPLMWGWETFVGDHPGAQVDFREGITTERID